MSVILADYIRTFTWDKKLEMVVKSTYSQWGGQGKSHPSLSNYNPPKRSNSVQPCMYHLGTSDCPSDGQRVTCKSDIFFKSQTHFLKLHIFTFL